MARWETWATGPGTVTSQSPPQFFSAGRLHAGDEPRVPQLEIDPLTNHLAVPELSPEVSLHFDGAIRIGPMRKAGPS